MIRERGQLRPLDYPPLTPQDTREIVYSILTNDQRKKLENDWQIDLSPTRSRAGPASASTPTSSAPRSARRSA